MGCSLPFEPSSLSTLQSQHKTNQHLYHRGTADPHHAFPCYGTTEVLHGHPPNPMRSHELKWPTQSNHQGLFSSLRTPETGGNGSLRGLATQAGPEDLKEEPPAAAAGP